MTTPADLSTINVLDPRGLGDLRRAAKTSDPAAIKAAARQFEAMFLQLVLKSMREATPKSDLFDNDQSRMYESLLDQQMSQVLSARRGIGLAEVIERQMQRGALADPAMLAAGDGVAGEAAATLDALSTLAAASPRLKFRAATPSAVGAPPPAAAEPVREAATADIARGFVTRVLPDANAAAQETGIPAAFLIAHAALESGWGRHEARRADGTPSHNLFGVKAGGGWTGERVTASTVEFVQGLAQRRNETFRAYGSYAESFADYARLLASNPRYADVLAARDAKSFAGGLQQAGYATDPAYSSKLERVIAVATSALGNT